MKSKILENIRNIRKSLKKTQADMAEELGMSLTAYGNFERGKTKLTHEKIEECAKVLHKNPSSVITGYETVEGEATTLEEYRIREVRFRDLLEEANDKIKSLEKELAGAHKIIDAQQHTIDILQDIRKMLEKQVKGDL